MVRKLERKPTPLPVDGVELIMSREGLKTLVVILDDSMTTRAYAGLPMPARVDIENLRNDALARLQRIPKC